MKVVLIILVIIFLAVTLDFGIFARKYRKAPARFEKTWGSLFPKKRQDNQSQEGQKPGDKQ